MESNELPYHILMLWKKELELDGWDSSDNYLTAWNDTQNHQYKMGLTEKLLLYGITKVIKSKLKVGSFKLMTLEMRENIVTYSINLGEEKIIELEDDDVKEIETKLGIKIAIAEVMISNEKLLATFTDEKGEKKTYTIRP